ncbi:dnaJ homolog subfamily C member 2 [Condylostylus longicornis]|uniref:dnaJ homolog subfamily C member 2 n=1 Tax=Condylostylus longicornis TaxID=2530218 RepID=UPI00244E1C32|nr:dnaJ homolog subfamily C member 2 [Condylostylus longicornis]
MHPICVPLALVTRKIQRVGYTYLKLKQKLDLKNSFSCVGGEEEVIFLEDNFEIDEGYLKSLDPKEWKDQDHYAVLGLKHKRFFATEEDIRRAYRKIVLLHHPDKRKAKGEEIKIEDDYFTCITKAYEVLGTTKTRKAYDSIDPEFDNSLPTLQQIEKNFYETFQKYFSLNSRWSQRKNVPSLGNENSSREEVDAFYSFWYDFESWREFSYLDEEDKEKGQDREERRWIEKQNKILRIKRKKEEMARIRSLVDLCYNNDPRILKFKKEDKDRKLAAKRAKMDAVQAVKAQEEKILKEAQLLKAKLDLAEQKRIEQIRIEKEQQKRALKKERKSLRDKAKESNFFSNDENERVRNMENVEKICELLKLTELQDANKLIEENGSEAFYKILTDLNKKIEEERLSSLKQKNSNSLEETSRLNDKNDIWNNDNTQLLIKSVNLFPAGTAQRWEVIATFMNQHSLTAGTRKFQAKDVLNKAKNLQSADFSQSLLKQHVNQAAFESFEKQKKDLKKVDKADITVSDEISGDISHQENNKSSVDINKNNVNETFKVWTKEEQALLEQAIKTYPISTPDRWDKIAECVPNRTKKDCLRRVKELVERVNAKKQVKQISK